MCNVHGRRINNDILKRKGSGYIASHGKDFMIAGRPVVHGRDAAHRPGRQRLRVRLVRHRRVPHLQAGHATTGRIYKISYGDAEARPQRGPAEAERRGAGGAADAHATTGSCATPARLLQERAAKPGWKGEDGPRDAARDARTGRLDAPQRLRALWALHVTGGLDDGRAARRCSTTGSEHVRGVGGPAALRERHAVGRRRWRSSRELAKADPSPVVRLYLASALQRLPLETALGHRGRAAEPRRGRGRREPAADDLVRRRTARRRPTRRGRCTLATVGEIPLVRQFIARAARGRRREAGEKGDLGPLVDGAGDAERRGSARPARRAPAKGCAAARA